jgi:glucokinase
MAKQLTMGIDVGGTKIHAGLVRGRKILKRTRIPTGVKDGSKAVLANIERAVKDLWVPGVKGIGLGMAGAVDAGKGVYRQGPNFPRSFRGVPIGALLKRKFGVPTRVDNDVHCFTLAEAVFGSGKGFSSVVGIAFGTGIGGGIALDGTLYRGRDNAAGEIGHMTIGASDAVCGCGRPGHFEALASGSAMGRLFEARTGRKVTAYDVERAFKAGDAQAREVFAAVAEAMGIGIANVIQLLNPDIIVIGGGIARVRPLWKPMLAEAKRGVIFPELRSTPIVRSALGDDANILGAAILAA